MPYYLDFNATTPVHPEVLELMIDTYKNQYGNASSRTHIFGQQAKKIVDNSRSTIAEILNLTANEIIFTSGATESNNLSLLGMYNYGLEQQKKHIISTVIEHASILEPLHQLSKMGFEVELIPVDKGGYVKAEDVIGRVRKDTLLVSVMHANNETGIMQPVADIGEELSKRGVFFHIDASQTFGKLMELKNIKYDLLSITAHKIFGPQGIGALILKSKDYKRPPLKPLIFGGGQEKGLRPGTLPVALIAGFGKAAQLAVVNHRSWMNEINKTRTDILNQLSATNYQLNGDVSRCLSSCINVSFPGIDSEALMLAVKESVSISNGSACTSSEYKPSHVLEAMGMDAESSVRISWGPQLEGIDLSELINFIKAVQ